MNIKITKIIINIAAVALIFGICAAGDTREESPAPFPVTVSLEKIPKDNRGTDVRLVRGITIDADGSRTQAAGRYDIVYYVDGLEVAVFAQQTLPYSFKWNFKGLRDGTYRLKFEIQDSENGTVLATGEETMEVAR